MFVDFLFRHRVATLLSDREALVVSTQGSHDTHLGKLLAQEDAVRDDITKSFQTVQDDVKTEHSEQNRARVSEIQRMLESYINDINDMLREEQNDDYDDI